MPFMICVNYSSELYPCIHLSTYLSRQRGTEGSSSSEGTKRSWVWLVWVEVFLVNGAVFPSLTWYMSICCYFCCRATSRLAVGCFKRRRWRIIWQAGAMNYWLPIGLGPCAAAEEADKHSLLAGEGGPIAEDKRWPVASHCEPILRPHSGNYTCFYFKSYSEEPPSFLVAKEIP